MCVYEVIELNTPRISFPLFKIIRPPTYSVSECKPFSFCTCTLDTDFTQSYLYQFQLMQSLTMSRHDPNVSATIFNLHIRPKSYNCIIFTSEIYLIFDYIIISVHYGVLYQQKSQVRGSKLFLYIFSAQQKDYKISLSNGLYGKVLIFNLSKQILSGK